MNGLRILESPIDLFSQAQAGEKALPAKKAFSGDLGGFAGVVAGVVIGPVPIGRHYAVSSIIRKIHCKSVPMKLAGPMGIGPMPTRWDDPDIPLAIFANLLGNVEGWLISHFM